MGTVAPVRRSAAIAACVALAFGAWAAPALAADAPEAGDGQPCTRQLTREVVRDRDADNVPLDETVVVTPNLEYTVPLQAGDVVSCTIVIRSRRSQPATYELTPFGLVGSRRGDLRYEFVDASDERWDSTAGPWLAPVQQRVIIPPRGVVRVPVRVTVPDDPPVGTAGGAIGVTSRSGVTSGDTSIGIESTAATIMLFTVGGDGRPELHLRDVDAPGVRWDREAWPLTANVDNDGTLAGTVGGRVRIRSVFGNEVASLGIVGETILPGGRSQVAVEWGKVPWIGLYRWDLRMQSDTDPAAVATTDGWLLALPPWWVLAIAGAALLYLLVRSIRNRADRWADEVDDEDDDSDSFDFDLAERQLRT